MGNFFGLRVGLRQQPALSVKEKEHLVILGQIAGSPDIMFDAIKSGRIFDPEHMERAHALSWKREQAIFERKTHRAAGYAQIRRLGCGSARHEKEL
jgi:hypothetical protein